MENVTKNPMADEHQKMVETIDKMTEEQGYPPTVQELADELNLLKTTAYARLLRMRELGMVKWADRLGRTLRTIR